MIRSIRQIRRDPLSFLNRMFVEYGDVVQFPIPDPPTYLVSHPELARQVLVSNARGYGKRTVQYTTLSLVTGEGLLTADTDVWRGQRRRLQPAFHHSTLELIAEHVRTSTERMITGWARSSPLVVDLDEAVECSDANKYLFTSCDCQSGRCGGSNAGRTSNSSATTRRATARYVGSPSRS